MKGGPLAEFERLLEDTAGDGRGPRGMEVVEGLELEGASGQLVFLLRMIFLWMRFPMVYLAPSQRRKD